MTMSFCAYLSVISSVKVGMQLCAEAHSPTEIMAPSIAPWMHVSTHAFVGGVGHASMHVMPELQTLSAAHALISAGQ